jgi:hypothetical protein
MTRNSPTFEVLLVQVYSNTPPHLIILMMEAAQTSETLVNLYQAAWHYNPEDSHLHTHYHENPKPNFRNN